MSDQKIQVLSERMLTDIFVVAGNYKQFELLIAQSQEHWKDEIKRKAVHYVSDAEMLRTGTGARVFLFGSYYKRRDWSMIDLEIQSRGHRALLVR